MTKQVCSWTKGKGLKGEYSTYNPASQLPSRGTITFAFPRLYQSKRVVKTSSCIPLRGHFFLYRWLYNTSKQSYRRTLYLMLNLIILNTVRKLRSIQVKVERVYCHEWSKHKVVLIQYFSQGFKLAYYILTVKLTCQSLCHPFLGWHRIPSIKGFVS